MNIYYINFLRNKNEANIFSYLIRAAENTVYNHVEISVDDGNKEIFFGAVSPVSRVATKEELLSHYTIIKKRKLSLKQGVTDREALDYLVSMLGIEYSVLQNVIIACKLFFVKLRNWFNSVKLNLSKYLNCTEYAGDFLQEKCSIQKVFASTETLTLKELDCDEIGELC